MPRELPGLYYDEEKKRYFPLSSKPQAPPVIRPKRPLLSKRENTQKDGRLMSGRAMGKGTVWAATERMRGSLAGSRRRRTVHDVLAFHIATTSQGTSHFITDAANNAVTAFQVYDDTSYNGGPFSVLAGDTQGWLYSLSGHTYNTIRRRELSMASSISAICRSGERCVAISFGQPCKIVIQESHPVETWTVLGLPQKVCHDVWTADLHECSLALGTAKKGILIPDITTGRGMQSLDIGSDVLSVHQQPHLVYIGARNGGIHRFDTRETFERQAMFNSRFTSTRSSITHLSVVREWELLVSTIRGDLETHDLRFPRGSTPLMCFAGHVNSYTAKLGLVVDSTQDFVFAGGQDCRMRAWSLRTGQPALPPVLPCSTSYSSTAASDEQALPPELQPFRRTFDLPVVAMQVTESERGTCLWAASAGELHRYNLGQQSTAV
ncbi:hypothetical protein BKA93DRAFT_822511 [Sparassis latifolia]|uniref:WD40 repeat-like protein n=1 Tax=Sparassis crispa TaxID=139825 RepID=A0A401GLL7_9APHY|nr:hypothetical protein SCP_0500940 [Sparassis crispa]GBE83050.1 hypothetical protein SCP_0500940 [Sparassis crispa]